MELDYMRYSLVGHRLVQGWIEPQILTLIAELNQEQIRQQVAGGIVEIGVHHGRFLIGLHLLSRAGEQTVGIDLFEDQAANIDDSGLGDEAALRKNLARHAANAGPVTIVRADSTTLDGDSVKAMAGGGVRLFSVDGGHTAEIVAHDMTTAANSIAAGGIVIGDDVFNEQWPGAAEGTLRFLDTCDQLVPFAIGFNKTLFASPTAAADYRFAVVEAAHRNLWHSKLTTMHGEPTVVCWVPTVRERARLAAKRILRPSSAETARSS